MPCLRSTIRIGILLVTVGLIAAMAPPADAVGHRSGLPADAPRALYQAEPSLPAAAGWPGSNTAFSRTSGTGRYADGGYYWTDWLYDDHGTTTASVGNIAVTAGTPSFGTYTYPPGDHNNGADIFRAAILLRPTATYWRVDWNTLVDPTVPVAEWAFDRDDSAATGAAAWPGGAGVHSRGIDRALIVSSRGAELINAVTGKVLRRLRTTVDRRAQSFVVRIPRRVLHPSGTWRIRLAAGLANSTGTGFGRPADALPTQTAVYNVTFRHRSQEPVADNFWDDATQTGDLAVGDVTPFSAVLRWKQLAHHGHTRQPRPTGWSDRWYVSDVDLGAGVLTTPATIADGQPNYLGAVQPYAVYVPRSYRPSRPAPLTFMLHSLTQNQNQYAATTPRFSKLACEDRDSICVTTLGRGPDGNYFDYAELDFWQVWHSVAAAYRLDPDRTVVSGFSMGGIGTNQLAMEHPDLFARAVTMAGGVGAVPTLRNLRWVPLYLVGGLEDELVPVTLEQGEANALAALGQRFRWLLYPLMDHIAYELTDSFRDAARFMGHTRRAVNPARFSFTWIPRNAVQPFSRRLLGGGLSWTQLPKYGVGTTGAYWVHDLRARHRSRNASVEGFSGMRRTRGVRTQLVRNLSVGDGPEPALATQLSWRRTSRPPARNVIRLRLTNVRRLRVMPPGAGFRAGDAGRLRVVTDGPVRITLGNRTIRVSKGTHGVRFTA